MGVNALERQVASGDGSGDAADLQLRQGEMRSRTAVGYGVRDVGRAALAALGGRGAFAPNVHTGRVMPVHHGVVPRLGEVTLHQS